MNKPKWLQYIEYIPLRFILTLTKILPYGLSCKIGRMLGIIIYFLIPSLKKTAFKTLNIAFSTTHKKEDITKIAKNCFKNLGQTIFEFIQLPKLKKNDKIYKYVEFGDSLNVIEELLSRGKGIIVLAGHIGNWEMMTAATSLKGYPINIIVRLLDNPLLDRYVESFREMFGTKIIPKQQATKYGFKKIKNKEILAFVIDQNWAVGGIFVPFFNKLAATVTGPALFAYIMKDTPVMAAYSYRNEFGKQQIIFEEIEVIKSDDRDEFIKLNMTKFTKHFEDVIKKRPEQWLWLHPRWKKRPDDEIE